MKQLKTLVLISLFSNLAFAGVAMAIQATAAASCGQFLTVENETIEVSPELLIMDQALKNHISVREIETARTQTAIQIFMSIVDPLGLTLYQRDWQMNSKLPEEILDSIQANLFNNNRRDYFQQILETSVERMNALFNKLASDKKYRDSIFSRLQELRKEPRQIAMIKDESTPQDRAESEQKFIDLIAQDIYRQTTDEFAVQAGLPARLSDQEAFVLSFRKFREVKLNFDAWLSVDELPLLIAKAYVQSLDPHSELKLPSQIKRLYDLISGQQTGIGIRGQRQFSGVRIVSVTRGGPADRAGVKAGDVITHVSSEHARRILESNRLSAHWLPLRALPLEMANQLLSGKDGLRLKLKINRDGRILEKAITAEAQPASQSRIHISIVPTAEGLVAMVKFDLFYRDLATQLRQEIETTLKNHDVKAIILDLRENGGGEMQEMVDVASLFISNGPAYIARTNSGSQVFALGMAQSQIWAGPLVVLTDRRTASAAELLSGILQDYRRAIVVGAPTTFGKGTMQKDISHQFGATVLTSGFFYTHTGRSPQLAGFTPDIVLPDASDSYVAESDFAGVLTAPKVYGSELADQKPMIRNYQSVVAELIGRSQKRQALWPKIGGDTETVDESAVMNRNTNEALQIAADLAAAEN